MAPLRHAGAVRRCPFTEVDRKWTDERQTDAFDPIRTSSDLTGSDETRPLWLATTAGKKATAISAL
jgi:hypothetical protein